MTSTYILNTKPLIYLQKHTIKIFIKYFYPLAQMKITKMSIKMKMYK